VPEERPRAAESAEVAAPHDSGARLLATRHSRDCSFSLSVGPSLSRSRSFALSLFSLSAGVRSPHAALSLPVRATSLRPCARTLTKWHACTCTCVARSVSRLHHTRESARSSALAAFGSGCKVGIYSAHRSLVVSHLATVLGGFARWGRVYRHLRIAGTWPYELYRVNLFFLSPSLFQLALPLSVAGYLAYLRMRRGTYVGTACAAPSVIYGLEQRLR